MPNLPGPYEIEFTVEGYTAPVRSHKIRLSVVATGSPAAGTLPALVNIQKAGGATATLQVVADQAWSFLRQFFNTGLNCSGFTLWKYVTGTLGKDFISAGAVTNPAGTNAGATTVSHQVTLSFRSANGGVVKTILLETSLTSNQQIALVPNGAGNPAQKWAAYIISVDSPLLARDDAYPVAALRDSRGENERIWRKVNRGT